MRCAGCEHEHTDGVDRPCACGCYGFIKSVRLFATEGCLNPDCPECASSGRHRSPGVVQ